MPRSAPPLPPLRRSLGVVRGEHPGPTTVLCGGLHGNEPAGVHAALRVLGHLAPLAPHLRGEVHALAGNIAALRRRVRYLTHDLNRGWTPTALEALRESPGPPAGSDRAEQLDLWRYLQDLPRPLAFLDLHTTSSASPPFVLFGDALRNRRLALSLPVTAILGLDEAIPDALLSHLSDEGNAGICFEAGQHDDPESIDRHAAAAWLFLEATGALPEGCTPKIPHARALLASCARRHPRLVEVTHRHVIPEGAEFHMLTTHAVFDTIRKGAPIALQDGAKVLAPRSGLLFMPRYQGQGEDGYFLVSRRPPGYLALTAALRDRPLSAAICRIPAIEPAPQAADAITVQPWVPQGVATSLLHLAGYRHAPPPADPRLFRRRPKG